MLHRPITELIKPSKANWQEMDYWISGEWQVVEERLDDLDQKKTRYNPSRINIFNALDACPMRDVKVAIIGQDPYPDPKFATGFAFSIPKMHKQIPPTLQNIFKEYCTDLRYPAPSHGNLEAWCSQGVLLWNAIPTCQAWVSMSHDWTEYEGLTKELVETLDKQGIVFVLMGTVARRYLKYIHSVDCVDSSNVVTKDITKNYTNDNYNVSLCNTMIHNDNTMISKLIATSHPSPRGSLMSNTPFNGSRLFSTINSKLHELEKEPINWRL